MTQIWQDPDIISIESQQVQSDRLYSLEDKLTVEQVLDMSSALGKLHDTYNGMAKIKADDRPDRQEMDRFLDQCYKLGFVCSDGSDRLNDQTKTPISDYTRVLEQDLSLVSSLSLREIRQVTHFLARSERWGDGGGKYGSGIIIQFAKTGLAAAFAERLS